MPLGGKLEKLLILAFADSMKAENGGKKEADNLFVDLINPESYTLDYKLKFSEDAQGHGTPGTNLKYEYTEPEEITFEFLFDNTGIIDGKARDNVADDLKRFKEVILEYKGDAHEPRHLKLVWGENSIFKGRATEVSVTYKMFNPDGSPTRAVAKVKFRSSVEDLKRAALQNRQSPDLTHVRTVIAGDTLDRLCHRIYGDPRYYLQVAEANKLGNFRKLVPGTTLVFPPLDGKGNQP